MRKCPVCRTRCETHKGNEAKTAFCTFFSLVLAGTWNRRREIFSSRMCTAGGVRRAAGVPLEQGHLPAEGQQPLRVPGLSPRAVRSLGGPRDRSWSSASPVGPARRGWRPMAGNTCCSAASPAKANKRESVRRVAAAACGRRSLRGTHGPLFLERVGRKFGWTRCVPPSSHGQGLIPGCERDPGAAEADQAGNSLNPVSGGGAAAGGGGTARWDNPLEGTLLLLAPGAWHVPKDF